MYLPQLVKDFLLRSSLLTIVKLIGALGRIILFRLLGLEGIGLYQMAYAYYGLLITFITGGFASAVSLATSKHIQHGKYLFQFSFFLLVFLGGAAGFFSYVYAPQIAQLFGKMDLSRPIQFLAPAILLVPVLSLMRGFLQGLQRYGYIATSELIEQVVRVAGMIVFATLLIDNGLPEAVGGAVLGAVSGALVAFLFLLFPLASSFLIGHSRKQTEFPVISVFIWSSIAIMGTRIIYPITDFIDSLLIPQRLLVAGYSVQEAT